MSDEYALRLPNDDDYYWKFKDSGGDGIAWYDHLILYRRRKYWFDKCCGVVTVNSWRMECPLTSEQVVDRASLCVRQELNGPLVPVTGYRYKGMEY